MLFYILVAQEHLKRKNSMTTLTTPQDAMASELTLTSTDDIPVIAQKFCELGLSENLLKALAEMNFVTPSSIQQEAIPQVLSGIDIIAKAPTGSGKTAAFAIPIIEKLDLNPENKSVQALVLCPTRELAIQVHREFEKLTKYFENVSVVSVYGGQNIEKQLSALKKDPQIVVATPGRLMDHLRRGSIKLDLAHTVVLDEADEMLDMGFREDIYTILEDTPVNRQTILFSATMAKDIIELTKRFQKTPNIVDVTDNLLNTPDIEQQYFEVVEKDKIELITRLLNLHNINLSLIFCNTKSNVDKVVEILKTKGCFADAIHGDMNQAQREKVMRGFRNGSVKILVATDVAGRGIDVKNIEAVFNYDLPRDDEDYIHRIGRTGRAGTSGIAFTFVSKKQSQSLRRIERANGIQIHKKEVPTFEEIQIARVSNFKNKIKSIIEEDDLSEYKGNINAMINDGVDAIDIASALLKFYMSKEGKKINQNMVFEAPQEESSEKRGTGRSRNRNGRKFGDGNRSNKDGYRTNKDGNRNNQNKGDFQAKKPNRNFNKKAGETISFDDKMVSGREDKNKNDNRDKNRKKKPSDRPFQTNKKASNKGSEMSKFFSNMNKKSKKSKKAG